MPSLTVEYYVGAAHDHRFRVRAANHEIIAQGEGYRNLSDAEHAVELMANGLRSATVKYHQPPRGLELGLLGNVLAPRRPTGNTFLANALLEARRQK